MAKSKYEYVKGFEVEDKLLPNTWIVVRIDGRGFKDFTKEYGFEKPNDMNGLELMNSCAVAVLEEFPDIIFAYGESDEYSFVFRRKSLLYGRCASKLLSITASLFTANYLMKWKEFFPQKDLRSPPSFDARAVCYPSNTNLRDYLAWRQVDCHINNLNNTCFWMLAKSGMNEKEAGEFLKKTQSQDKNELLFKQFSINYNTLPAIFRKGSCIFKVEVEEIVKYPESGDPVERIKTKVVVDHVDIIGERFWKDHSWILED